MKKNSKLLLTCLPLLFLVNCSKNSSNGNKPASSTNEQSKDDSSENNSGTVIELKKLHVTYENGDAVSNSLHLLYDDVLKDGGSKKLKATSNVPESKITFSSNDQSVASVTSDGLITALKANASCKITVSASDESVVFDITTYDVNSFFGISKGAVTKVADKDIETLTLPTGPTVVKNDALVGLNRVKTLNITEGYTVINKYVNDWCLLPPNVENVSISSTFQKIDNEFWAVPKIKQITVDPNNAYYKVYDNKFLYKIDGYRKNWIVRFINGFDGNVTDEIISATNNSILQYGGFSAVGLSSVKDLVLNPTLTLNRYNTFVGSSVEKLSIPKSYFEGLTYNQVVDKIRPFSFSENLKEVKIYDDNTGDSVSSVGNCSIIDGALYFNDNGNLTLLLGTTSGIISPETKTIYKFAFSGREFENKKLKIPNSVTSMYSTSFLYTNLEKVYIPNSLVNLYQETIDYDDCANYGQMTSCISFTMYKNGNLILPSGSYYDSETEKAMNKKFTCFFGSNNNLEIYDGSIYSRNETDLITLKGKGYERFKYHFDISTETFDTL